MAKNNCLNCANRVGTDYCTMQKDMNGAKYKNCKEHKILPPKPKPKPFKRTRRLTGVESDDKFTSDFMKFLKKGGYYSCVTGKYTPN